VSVNNYFKVHVVAELVGAEDGKAEMIRRRRDPARFFFFDDRRIADTERAYALACAAEAERALLRVTVARPALHHGAWDEIAIVGHRPLRDVRQESFRAMEKLATATEKSIKDSWAKAVERLHHEVEDVEDLFRIRRGGAESVRPDADN